HWNIVMVFFNMIPAFPMDGGRVLRALLALVVDYGKATRLAATIGQAIALTGAVLAMFTMQHSEMLVIVAIFIFFAAGQEAAYVTDQEAIRGLLVSDAMVTEFRSLPEHALLRDAVEALLAGSQHDFPILNAHGAFAGMLSRTALIAALSEHGAQHPISSVAEVCHETLNPRQLLADAAEILRASPLPALPVINPNDGRLVGLVTAENIAEMIMIRSALAK
ncbi:MAG: CBS domain-containing protein, partial [Roseimicrobium sp.]